MYVLKIEMIRPYEIDTLIHSLFYQILVRAGGRYFIYIFTTFLCKVWKSRSIFQKVKVHPSVERFLLILTVSVPHIPSENGKEKKLIKGQTQYGWSHIRVFLSLGTFLGPRDLVMDHRVKGYCRPFLVFRSCLICLILMIKIISDLNCKWSTFFVP